MLDRDRSSDHPALGAGEDILCLCRGLHAGPAHDPVSYTHLAVYKRQDLLSAEAVGGVTRQTGYFRAMIMTQVKTYLAQTIRQEKINILEIDEKLSEMCIRDRVSRPAP